MSSGTSILDPASEALMILFDILFLGAPMSSKADARPLPPVTDRLICAGSRDCSDEVPNVVPCISPLCAFSKYEDVPCLAEIEFFRTAHHAKMQRAMAAFIIYPACAYGNP